MALSDELNRLDELRGRGVLSDAEFERAKAQVLDGAPPLRPAPLAALNALRRSRTDRWIAGVCGGLAAATGAEAWVWRLLFALLALCGGAGVIAYLLLWIFVPQD
ncbi:PspC domain-containing protein [Caenimonas terrae]|uniref:PspC domain-containing protein n=1 Tax=Caenimonas terrae TaxID=696074 RepID=A0ABW0NFT3_9BURK